MTWHCFEYFWAILQESSGNLYWHNWKVFLNRWLCTGWERLQKVWFGWDSQTILMARIHEDHNHILCNPLLACVQTIYIPFIHLPPDKTMSTSQHFLSSNIRIEKIVPRSKIRFCTLQIPFHGVQTIPNTDILAYLCSYDGSWKWAINQLF